MRRVAAPPTFCEAAVASMCAMMGGVGTRMASPTQEVSALLSAHEDPGARRRRRHGLWRGGALVGWALTHARLEHCSIRTAAYDQGARGKSSGSTLLSTAACSSMTCGLATVPAPQCALRTAKTESAGKSWYDTQQRRPMINQRQRAAADNQV